MSQGDTSVPQLDSDLLRSFLAVAKAGSVSGGAARLLRTQSAVSLQVQKLEEIVAQQLFDRHGRGVSLTARGEQLLPIARQVVEALDQVVIAMRGPDDKSEIRLGIPEEYSDTLLSSILSGFSLEQPSARILVRCGTSVEFPAALAAGDLDIALHTPENVGARDIVVHREAAIWAGSAFHEIEHRRPLPVALFDRACWWRERCLDLLQKAGVDYEIVCTSESVAGVRAAISAGIAVGVLPQGAFTDRVRRLSDAILPQLGETALVLTRSNTAPTGLADSLAAIVSKTVRSLE
ncbi:LysR substrate-binding domain-containing protein [Rhizobium laguerreae]|uniref:LysR substrate-binding domain-containing protein n=1 Tax=Rhizobium laguerreae TaxID=1076926 RepID=UPI001C908BE8|nr:LysR substrate-binding domain-containing protein [Rhizobium laguerreae]MBY3143359.1 LysR family transcriptional regulator [Rhizobium laguerreae]MBY3202760.1 LysR family transcriptional regulator [Rhizobium laguerreae]